MPQLPGVIALIFDFDDTLMPDSTTKLIESRVLATIKRAVTFTEKTRFLFEIQKGITPQQTAKDPYLVNKDVPATDRRVPFSNMIYVGDGLTDIPCFSLIGHNRGRAFAVF